MLLDTSHSSLLIVDVQDRLLPAMVEPEQVVACTGILLTAAKLLQIPVTVSEQYPKGLGCTVPELAIASAAVFEKLSFSCWRDAAMKERGEAMTPPPQEDRPPQGDRPPRPERRERSESEA